MGSSRVHLLSPEVFEWLFKRGGGSQYCEFKNMSFADTSAPLGDLRSWMPAVPADKNH